MADKKMPRSNTRFPQRKPDHPRLQQVPVFGELGKAKKPNIFEITGGEAIEIEQKDKPYVKPLPS
jgi:phage/plasmid-associated DNA primase